MKKSILLIAFAATMALVSCGGNSNQKIGEADASTDIEVSNSNENTANEPTEENFVQWTQENCGIDLGYDQNLWLPAYFKLVPNGFEYSMYAKDPIDNMDEMVVKFAQKCLDASQTHTVGPDPQSSAVEEIVNNHFTKTYKNELDPEEGMSYLGAVIYEYNGAQIDIAVNFTQAVKSSHVTYTVQRQ